MTAAISVGVVGGGPPSRVDDRGSVEPAGAAWTLEWWVGAADRWRVPAREVAVRQRRVDDVAVVATALRVPGGDAVHRVYGVGAPGHPLVVEVENRSPAPLVVALVVRGASRVAAHGARVAVDQGFVLTTRRAPSRWAEAVGGSALLPVATGRASTGSYPGRRDRAGRLEVAFLHPVAHRTTLRAAVTHGRELPALDLRALPDAASVARGWGRVLDRGMRADLPDPALTSRLRAARAEVLLRGQARSPGAAVVAALEDWGFDAEAADAWRHSSGRVRRRAAARPAPSSWSEVAAVADDADFLVAARRLLVDDRAAPGTPIAVAVDVPATWRGHPFEVRDAPVAAGTVSYAIRWHGERPALLWEVPDGVCLRAPALDPQWQSSGPRGETLLARAEGAA